MQTSRHSQSRDRSIPASQSSRSALPRRARPPVSRLSSSPGCPAPLSDNSRCMHRLHLSPISSPQFPPPAASRFRVSHVRVQVASYVPGPYLRKCQDPTSSESALSLSFHSAKSPAELCRLFAQDLYTWNRG